MERAARGERRRRGATRFAFVMFACVACDTETTSSLDGRHDAGLDAASASGSGGAESGGAGGRVASGGAGGRVASGGGSGNVNGGTAGVGGAGGVDAGAEGGQGGSDAGGGVDCASAVDQGPCSKSGASCGGPCTDICSFCNILVCTGGHWQHMEVFPAPCFDCGTRRCQMSATFCSVIHAATDSFECLPVPTACQQDVTCSCIQPKVSADSCTAAGQGEVTVERSGG